VMQTWGGVSYFPLKHCESFIALLLQRQQTFLFISPQHL
jgi:hypothetical protein